MRYYISNEGNDESNGTSTSTAWATISKVNSSSFEAGDQISFRCGDVFTGTLNITWAGVESNPIVFDSYGSGNKPIITGLVEVSTWEDNEDGTWISSDVVSLAPQCNMVIIDGENSPMGRYPKVTQPNSGYLIFEATATGESITSSSLSGTPDWTGAEVVIRANAYKLHRRTITEQDEGTLSFASISDFIEEDSGFFIQNDIRCVTEQNDWYYDHSTGKITIYSSSEPTDVKIAVTQHLVVMEGNFILFSGLVFEGANDCAIFCDSSKTSLLLQYCDFRNIGIGGIYGQISNVGVENCTFNDINNSAISVDYGNNVINISDSVFNNIGIYQGMKDIRVYTLSNNNIELPQANDVIIQRNRITNVGYNGIWFYGNNVLIKQNYIDNFCKILSDGGAIYTFTGEARDLMENVLITENICLNGQISGADGTSYPMECSGIYLDMGSANVEISYNTVANMFIVGVHISSFGGVNMHHNTIYNCSRMGVFLIVDSWLTPSETDSWKYNTIVAKEKRPVDEEGNYWDAQKCIMYFITTADPIADLLLYANDMDYNCLARPIADDDVIHANRENWGAGFMTIAEWQSFSGQDLNSYGSPQALLSLDDITIEYNDTAVNKTIFVDEPKIDMAGTHYPIGNITIAPYRSIILMTDYNPSTDPPEGTTLHYIWHNGARVLHNGKPLTVPLVISEN